MGSASAYQLAKRGLSVLGLDQYAPPHSNGSTHGSSRIMRLAIGEGEHYTPLSKRSYELFREIEQKTDTNLLNVTGMLTISAIDKDTIETEGEFFDKTVTVAKKYGIRHDVLSANEIRTYYPQFAVSETERGYFEYDAGYLKPEDCIRAQLQLAVDNGCSINTNERVDNITSTARGIVVTTDANTYCADQIVLSAGPWLPELLAPQYKSLFQPFRLVQYWFDIQEVYNEFTPEKFPIFFWQLPGVDQWTYGFPALNGPNGGFSVGVPDRSPTTTPDSIDRSISSQEIEAVYREYVSRCFPKASKHCVKTNTCLYTATPDGEFVIDRLPHAPGIIICSPCSGHGFKHSAAIGESVAELIATGSSTIDLSAFMLSRLTTTGAKVPADSAASEG